MFDGAPFAHGPQGEHDDDGSAGSGDSGADERAESGGERGITGGLEIDEGIPDDSARNPCDDDGCESDHAGAHRRER